jgi:hypothetical protein
MAKPNGRGGWELTDEDVAEIAQGSGRDDGCLRAIAALFKAEASRRLQADIALATAVSAAIDEGHPAADVFAVLNRCRETAA